MRRPLVGAGVLRWPSGDGEGLPVLRLSTSPSKGSVVENLVIASEVLVYSEEPLLATLTLHTTDGRSEFQINQSAAEALIDVLQKMIQGAKRS